MIVKDKGMNSSVGLQNVDSTRVILVHIELVNETQRPTRRGVVEI